MRKIVCVALLMLFAASPFAASSADAAVRIQSSAGGRIGDFLELFMAVRDSGQSVVIDGPCLSACTLVLSVVPRDRICVTSRAVLGFHAAWMPDRDGRVHTHSAGTQMMLASYPSQVRTWIKRNGGLSRKTILLRGRPLMAMYRPCG